MDIQITEQLLPKEQCKSLPSDISQQAFGSHMSNHMFMMDWEEGQGWSNHRIIPYQAIPLFPAAKVFHYGQEVFEGLKAYGWEDGTNVLFRPHENFKRMSLSAARLAMPKLPEDEVLFCLKRLLQIEKEWIPREPNTSLYIRPLLIGTEPTLGLDVSKTFLFMMILTPVAPFYSSDLQAIKIWATSEYSRAALKGTGQAKCGGNYAAGLVATKQARSQNYQQELWLDATQGKYIEEVGSMNLFFRIGDELVTPSLKTGTILAGITRKSVIEICRYWGIQVTERMIELEEVVKLAKSGELTEAFGVGTAVVVAPVSQIDSEEYHCVINHAQVGEWTQKIYKYLTDLQYGREKDIFQWIEPISKWCS